MAEAERVLADGRWSAADTARLDEAFERSARAALRAPVLQERSLVLRRIAKRVVPVRYRPTLRRVVAHLDTVSRRLVASTSRLRGDR